MNYDILNKLENILNETWKESKERADDFIKDSKKRGTYHRDIINNQVKEDDENFREEELNLEPSEEEINDQELDDKKEKFLNVDLSKANSVDHWKSMMKDFKSTHGVDSDKVANDLEKYHSNLSEEERQIFLIIFTGLIQIGSTDIDGSVVERPSDRGFKIEKVGAASIEKRKSMNRAKTSRKEAEKSNNPIKVGESVQEKKEIFEVLRKNNV
tara:strand:+ start:1072 stop:1710 length:639 start_codon:yes stop_codon:yes gene_type:complete